MSAILEVARKHNLAVVEDCAQAFDCTYRDRPVGTFGTAASFSLQQGKQITSGEGGIIVTDDPEVYERASLYCNCGMAWYRYGREAPRAEPVGELMTRGHFAMGHNYRMTAWQGAVAMAGMLGMVAGIGLSQMVLDRTETTPRIIAITSPVTSNVVEANTASLAPNVNALSLT